jgi:outer membrane lipoprotein-sorting protein
MINRNMKNVLIFTVILFFLIKKCFSNDAHKNLISLLEMNYPLEFIFEQKYNNDKINGWMVIAGNGMARTEFAPPNNNLIVADGKWIMFYDPEIDRTTYIPLDKGIFKAFLKPTALIEDKIFQIKETKDNNKIIFTLNLNMNNSDQKIKLYFDKISKNLLGWRLYESLNDFIEVKIINHQKFTTDNKKLLNEIFKLTESEPNTGMQYHGPYDGRKVKKFLGSGRLNQ